jgi:hypothetical protein
LTDKKMAGPFCEDRPKARKPKSHNQHAAFIVTRQKLQSPPRLVEPKARPQLKPKAAAPVPEAGLGRLGPWIVLGRDTTLKRAAAKCTHCQTIREISLVGDMPSCGCSGSLRPGTESFAEAVVAAEKYVAVSRHRGRR